MAHSVFLFMSEFCGVTCFTLWDKQGIVAKAVMAARGVSDMSLPTPLSDDRRRVLGPVHEHQNGDVKRFTTLAA